MKLAITKKDQTVLLISEITKDYKWFYELLEKNDRITEALVESLDNDQKNFIEHMLPVILQQAILEWREKAQYPIDLGENKENWTNCSLCGQPNRYIHFIVNRLTGKEINVGSDCVKEYSFNDGNTEHQRKEARKIRRLNILNTELPGIKRTIENWLNQLENFELWIPLDLSKKYRDIGEQLKKRYEDFLEGKESENSISELKNLIEQGQKELEVFRSYSNDNRDNNFLVTKEMYRWIQRNMGNPSVRTAFEQLKNDGRITYQIAHRISEEGFMKKIVRLMNRHLEEMQIVIEEARIAENNYSFYVEQLKGCRFYISHQELLQNFGWVLFGEEPFVEISANEFVKIGKVNDEQSMYVLLKALARKLRKEPIKLNGYDYDFNEIVLFDENGRCHKVVNLKAFVSKYKVLAISDDKDLLRGIKGESGHLINLNEYRKSRDGYIPL